MITSNIRGVGNRTVKLFNPAVAARLLFQPGLNLKNVWAGSQPRSLNWKIIWDDRVRLGGRAYGPARPYSCDQADLRQGNIIETRCL